MAPGAPPRRFAKERVSPRCVGAPPLPPRPPTKLPLPGRDQLAGTGGWLCSDSHGHGQLCPQTPGVQIPVLPLLVMGPWVRELTPLIKTCTDGKFVVDY